MVLHSCLTLFSSSFAIWLPSQLSYPLQGVENISWDDAETLATPKAVHLKRSPEPLQLPEVVTL
eukprot:5545012-Amphidinium_carterae.1